MTHVTSQVVYIYVKVFIFTHQHGSPTLYMYRLPNLTTWCHIQRTPSQKPGRFFQVQLQEFPFHFCRQNLCFENLMGDRKGCWSDWKGLNPLVSGVMQGDMKRIRRTTQFEHKETDTVVSVVVFFICFLLSGFKIIWCIKKKTKACSLFHTS